MVSAALIHMLLITVVHFRKYAVHYHNLGEVFVLLMIAMGTVQVLSRGLMQWAR